MCSVASDTGKSRLGGYLSQKHASAFAGVPGLLEDWYSEDCRNKKRQSVAHRLGDTNCVNLHIACVKERWIRWIYVAPE